ncbi:hypothetical protein AB0G15_06415 [Streptosporangium sp. NPDC023825]|uniref:hypothetical protein n=1 Tax=Streptosporangium sp. NPDC023825 TaxID=3154909 RepID=UPI003429B411
MSFGAYARRVRNQELPYGLRYVMAELTAHETLPLVRRAWHGDAERIADIFLAARGQMSCPERPATVAIHW